MRAHFLKLAYSGPGQTGLRYIRSQVAFEVPLELVHAQKDSGAAFTLACTASGLDDKQIYSELGLNQGYFSKIKRGTATLQERFVPKFCKIVGNEIYLDWRDHHAGRVPAKHSSESHLAIAKSR